MSLGGHPAVAFGRGEQDRILRVAREIVGRDPCAWLMRAEGLPRPVRVPTLFGLRGNSTLNSIRLRGCTNPEAHRSAPRAAKEILTRANYQVRPLRVHVGSRARIDRPSPAGVGQS